MPKPLLLAAALVALSACQTTTQVASSGGGDQPQQLAVASEVDSAQSPPETEVPEAPIPAASLLPLLQAEFLLRERRFDEALALLTEQALLLSDPALTRRALRLAEFREDNTRSLSLAVRLAEQDQTDAAAAATAMGLLIRAGNAEQALRFARTARERGARINAPALMVVWESLSPPEQRSMATAIEALAQDWPEDIDIAIALAYLRREQGALATALQVLEPVLVKQPDEERALLLWTQLQIDMNGSDPYAKIEAAVARNPDNESLRLQLAKLLASAELLERAREQFAALLTLNPRNGDYLFSLALLDIEAGEPKQALLNLEALVALGQRPDDAYYYVGRVREDLGEDSLAIEAYDRVTPSRQFLDATRRSAELRLNSGDTRAFRDGFSRSRAQNPGQAEQLYGLEAQLLRDIEELESAIEVYTEALDLFPESMNLQYGRAMTFEMLDDIASMESDLRKILARDPNNATTLNALGYTLTVHTQRYEEAAQLIEKALELSPGEPAILDSLGWVYFKLGRYVQAVDLLTEAYQLFPDAEVAAHLGEALWVAGKEQNAREIWRASLAEQPEASHVTETLKRLGVSLQEVEVD